jgi:hypothetical protein
MPTKENPYECQPPLPQKEKTPPPTWDLEKKDLLYRVSQLEKSLEILYLSMGEGKETSIAQLEEKVSTCLNSIITLSQGKETLAFHMLEFQTKLKETIRAVERLATGHSIGCLGLPTEESWDPPV